MFLRLLTHLAYTLFSDIIILFLFAIFFYNQNSVTFSISFLFLFLLIRPSILENNFAAIQQSFFQNQTDAIYWIVILEIVLRSLFLGLWTAHYPLKLIFSFWFGLVSLRSLIVIISSLVFQEIYKYLWICLGAVPWFIIMNNYTPSSHHIVESLLDGLFFLMCLAIFAFTHVGLKWFFLPCQWSYENEKDKMGTIFTEC